MGARRGLDVRPWRPGDEDAICRLFRRTFGRDKGLDRWRWQHLGQGEEPLVAVAREDGGEVVAHFAGVPLRARVDGREATIAVAVDSMVEPALRRGLRRRSLFAEVVECWIDRYCGHGPVQLAYGLANREAFRIGHRLLGYAPLGSAVLLARRLPAGHGAPPDDGAQASPAPPPDSEELWARSATRSQVAARRDARFLAWRYHACPGGGYEFLARRRRGRLAALGVFRAAYAVPDSGTLADVVWDGVEPADLAACVREAESRAAANGLRHLAVLLPAGTREAAVLADLGYGPAQLGLTLVARAFRPALDVGRLPPRFWFTCGDFDLV